MNPTPESQPTTAVRPASASVSRRPLWLSAVALAVLATTGAAFLGLPSSHADAPTEQAPAATSVSVATVAEQPIALWDEFSGRLEAVQRVDLRPRVAGAVQTVNFREGSLVQAGDLLFSLDPAPFSAEVDRAQAQVAAAQARVAYSQSELERATRLWEERAIAQRELDERQNAQREADANLRAAQAALQSARLNLGYAQVRAPISGRIGRIEVTAGNLVAAGAGAPVLTTLVSVNPIYASFEADEQLIAQALQGLGSGQSARARIERIPVQMGTAEGGKAEGGSTPYSGHLQLVDNQVDVRSGTVRVRAVFDNPDGRLMPVQFARLRMGQAQTRPALLVHERAVGTDQSKKFVLVVGADHKAEYREVTLGAPVDGLRVVKSGLKAGEQVVVNGLQHIRPGALVSPQTVPMKPEAAATATPAAPASPAA